MLVAYYVTGHGFGHATRVAEVVRHLIAAGHEVFVCSGAPQFIFELVVPEQSRELLHFRKVTIDSGALQKDALSVDCAASLAGYANLDIEAIVAEEVAFLRDRRVNVVAADMPPLACAAARRAGIPCAVVTNFTWDFIYAEFASLVGEVGGGDYSTMLEGIAAAYAQATVLLRLPGHTPMPAFRRVEDVPLVVRLARRSRDEVRAQYGIAPDAKVVIFNFGGQKTGWALKEEFLPPGWVCILCTGLPVQIGRRRSSGQLALYPASPRCVYARSDRGCRLHPR